MTDKVPKIAVNSKVCPMPTYKWQFAPRFRRNAFGWRSNTPIQRLKEALAEIKAMAKKDPVLAAEGAVLLIEKISPALEQVDSSSGAIGSVVNKTIAALVPFIARADVDQAVRQRWLERLWDAIQDDGIPYIEGLGGHWGELCGGTELASQWADEFLPAVRDAWKPSERIASSYFQGTAACLACLLAADRHEELLGLLESARFKWWHYRQWGVKALLANGQKAEALQYAEASHGLNEPSSAIAEACEAILRSSGLDEDAYTRYAIMANQSTTHLATFRAITKKYPHKPASDILRDLVASTPGAQGKWFAAAKDAGLYDQAIALVGHSPADPRTLTRAARDFANTQPAFALHSGLAALRWMAAGHGYEITSDDVMDAWLATSQAARQAGLNDQTIKMQVKTLITYDNTHAKFMRDVLMSQLQA